MASQPPITEEEKGLRVLVANFRDDETVNPRVSSEDAQRLLAAQYAVRVGDALELTAKGRAARRWRAS